MAKLDNLSKQRISTCHPDIQKLCTELSKTIKYKVSAGYLGRTDQDAMYKDGLYQQRYPKSHHNVKDKDGKFCSNAITMSPYEADGKTEVRGRDSCSILQNAYFAGYVKCIAGQLGIGIEWKGLQFLEHGYMQNYVNLNDWELTAKVY